MNTGLLSQVTLEDLTGDLRLIAEALGIETARRMFAEFRGCSLFIPSRLPRAAAVRYVKREAARGRGFKDIARDLGFSVRCVQRMSKEF